MSWRQRLIFSPEVRRSLGSVLSAVLLLTPGFPALAQSPAALPSSFLYAPPVLYLSGGQEPSSAASGDVNGDGWLDLVAVHTYSSATAAVFLNDGTGAFLPAVTYVVGGSPSHVTVTDLNGDGAPDLAVANNTGVSVLLNRNDGSGTFFAAAAYPSGGSTRFVAAGDLDGDGDADLAVTNPVAATRTFSVLLGQGDGTFGAPVTYNAPNNARLYSTQVADLDGDGDLDLAFTEPENDYIHIRWNQGGGAFGDQTAPVAADYLRLAVGDFPSVVVAADLNEDGHLDLATGNADDTREVTVYLSSGGGNFGAPAHFNLTGSDNVRALVVQDVDRDNRPDLIAGRDKYNSAETIMVLLNNGSGGFGSESGFATTYKLTSLAAGNWNNDEWPADLFITEDITPYGTGGGTVSVHLHRRPDVAAPEWPSASLTQTGLKATSLTLDWTAAQDDTSVTAYRVYQDGAQIMELSASTLSQFISGLVAGTPYTFKVEAADAAGNWSAAGPTVTVTTPTALATPTLTTDTPARTQEPQLSLSGFADSTATVTLYYQRDGGAKTEAGTATAHTSAHGFYFLTITLPGEGSYSITAEAASGVYVSAESAPLAITLDQSPPDPPTGLTVTATAAGAVITTLSWTASPSPDVASYLIRRDGDPLGQTADGTVTSFQQVGAVPRATYQYEIFASDGPNLSATAATVSATAPSLGHTLTLAALSTAGGQGSSDSEWPAISGSGRFVAFASYSSELVAGDANSSQDVFVRDRDSDGNGRFDEPGAMATARVSIASDLSEGDKSSWDPAISDDGRYVAFKSLAANLVPGDTNGREDIFTHDRQTGRTVRVSIASDGTQANHRSGSPSLSGDGRYVVFASQANNLVAGDSNGQSDIFLHDRDADGNGVFDEPAGVATTLISRSSDGALGNDNSDYPTISADGSTIAFLSYADNLENGVGGNGHIFLHDRTQGTVTAVSKYVPDPNGSVYDQGPEPAISADGRFVVFIWEHSDGDRNAHLYLYDAAEPGVQQVDVTPTGASVNESAQWSPSISGDGRYITFSSWATDLVPGTWQSQAHVYRRDREAQTTVRVSNYAGETGCCIGRRSATSYDGQSIAYDSYSALQVANDTTATNGELIIAYFEDTLPPAWPQGSSLSAENVGGTLLTLDWTAAQDSVDVTGYRIHQGETLVDTVSGSTRSATITGLTPDTSHTFAVQAGDSAGNWSLDGPTLTVRTAVQATASLVATPVATGGGLVDLFWDAIPPGGDVTAIRIKRSTGDGPEEPVQDISDPVAVRYQDAGLAAETTYTYKIYTVDAAGAEQLYAGPTAATTPALRADVLTWLAPRGMGNVLILGGTLALTLAGEPDRQAEAVVSYRTRDQSGNVQSTQAVVALTPADGTPGEYRGIFAVGEGVTEVTAVAATMTDGAGHTVVRTAASLPAEVSGAIRVTVIGRHPLADSLLNGTRLTAWSETRRSGDQVALTGTGTYLLEGVAAASDYRLRITAPGGMDLAEEPGVTVAAGQVTTLSLTPLLLATLEVRVLGLHDLPLVGEQATVTFNDALTGGFLSRVQPAADGMAVLADRFEGESISVAVVPMGVWLVPVRQAITLQPGRTQATVRMVARPRGTVSGRVTEDGNGVEYAQVTVTQEVDGVPATHRTQTDAQGNYSLSVVAGQARVTATARAGGHGGAPVTVTVSEGGTARVDLALLALRWGQTEVVVRAHYLGEAPQLVAITDWRMATHFSLQLSGPHGGVMNQFASLDGVPGESVRACISGMEAHLPDACAEAPFSEEMTARIVIEAVERARITGSVIHQNAGQPARASGYLWALDPSGQRSLIQMIFSRNDQFQIGLSAPGRYAVGLGNQVIEVEVSDGEILDLGEVVLLPSGDFRGRVGNGLTAVPRALGPGGTVSLRAAYHNAGTAAAASAVIVLEVPAQSTLRDDSVTLNGAPVTASQVGSNYEIPLGTVFAGLRGVVTYQLQVSETATLPALDAIVKIRYQRDGVPVEEVLGVARLLTPSISLSAPQQIHRPDTTVSGRAPVESIVRVYDGNLLLGETRASAGGFWRLGVTLPDLGSPTYHPLRAEAEKNGQTFWSATSAVRYDSEQVRLQRVEMRQIDGRLVSFDPTEGTAYFPYVFVPGNPFHFTLTFTDPDAVTDVEVKMRGPRQTLRAAAVRDGNVYRATLALFDPGPISISYKVRPDLRGLLDQPVPTEEQLRQRLPQWMGDYVLLALTSGSAEGGVAPAEGNAPCLDGPVTQSARFALPQAGGEELEASLTVHCGVTIPADARRISPDIPVYGLAFSVRPDGDGYIITAEGYIPDSALGGTNAALRLPAGRSSLLASRSILLADGSSLLAGGSSLLAGGSGLLAAGIGPQAGGSGGSSYFKVATKVGGAAWGLASRSWDTLSQFEKLDKLISMAANCSGPSGTGYLNRVEDLNTKILAGAMTRASLQALGVLLAPETFGVGTVVLFTAGAAMDHAVSTQVNGELDALKQEILADGDCENDEENENNDHDGDVADPTWIYDPSGYVYEAVESGRLEGVTTTVLYKDAATGTWVPWDAAWFMQENPQITDPQGRYGWDVPPGQWMVVYAKDGYQTAYSAELTVPPPHFDVNVGMVSLREPEVAAATAVSPTASAGFIDVTFDKYMKASTLTTDTFTVFGQGGGRALDGTLAAVDAQISPGGAALARTFRFTPATPLASGSTYTLTVDRVVQSYAGQMMAADYQADVVIPTSDGNPPVISGQTPANGSRVSVTLPQIRASLSDPSGIDASRITLMLDGGVAAHSFDPVAGLVSFIPGVALAEGTHTVSLSVTDAAGNTATTPAWSFTVDTTRPALTVTPSPAAPAAAGPVTITITSSEPLTFAPTVTVISPAGESERLTIAAADATTWAGTHTVEGAVPNGTYQVAASGLDLAGNSGIGSAAFTTGLPDSRPPLIMGTVPLTGSFLSTLRPVIEGAAADESALDPTSIQLTVDGAAVAHTYDQVAGTIAYTPAADLAQGRHDVLLTLADSAGNSAQSTWSFTVDSAAPTLTVTVSPPALAGAGTVTITVISGEPLGVAPAVTATAAGEAAGSVAMTASGSGRWTGTFGVPVVNAGREYTVTATGRDWAGNPGTGTARFTASPPPAPPDPVPPADETAPVLTVTVDPAALEGTGTVTITVASDEALAAAPVVTVGASLGTVQVVPAGEKRWTGTYSVVGVTADTTYTVTVTGTDAAGNAGSGSGTFAVRVPPAPTPIPEPSPDQTTVAVGQGGQSLSLFDGALALEIPQGAFPAGTRVTVRRFPAPEPPGLRSLSPAYEIEAGGAKPGQSVLLAIRYDDAALGGLDPRKLGLYRQDDADPDRWTYVGGAVDPAAGTVRFWLPGFSRYAVMAYERSFADLSTHWARNEVEVLVSRHLVNGVSPEEFQPDRQITRAELAKLLVSMLATVPTAGVNVESSPTPTFTDVAPDAWYYAWVETAARLGLVKGSEGRFRPSDPVSRQEMAAMIVRAMGREEEAQRAAERPLHYSDADQVAPWARGYVAICELGLMNGVTPESFGPREGATRAQAAVVVLRSMSLMGLVTAE